MARKHIHSTHPDIVKRLKRAEGHLRKVIAMIEAHEPCLNLAQQLHAVEKAITNAKATLIHDHMDHCLESAAKGGAHDLGEFKQIAKFLT
jgi:DNA-binding FrmR family transcriptional regulator